METAVKAKSDEKSVSNVSIIIKVTRNKKFNWDRLRETWQRNFEGTISELTKLESRYQWSFTWKNVDFKALLEQAEEGKLDKDIVSVGGVRLLEILENQECIYQFIPEISLRKKISIRDVDQPWSKKLAANVDVLLITVTEVETNAVLNAMEPWPEEKKILRGQPSLINYWFGQFGQYRAAHCTCTMGSKGLSGSAQTTADAMNEIQPKAVLLLGIAFGVDRKSQRLGDVIVANSVYSYNPQKVDPNFTLSRGSQTDCGAVLSERFRVYIPDWKLTHRRGLVLAGKRPIKVFQGLMLSGDTLIDNKKYRDDLLKLFKGRDKKTRPYGGEMEGAGAYPASERLEAKLNKRFEIILIKGICDWADGEKNDRAQPLAAYAAVSLAKFVLNKPDVLAQLGAKGNDNILASKKTTSPNGKKVHSGYKSIINALNSSSLVPFLGPGINPHFYMDLAVKFDKIVRPELLNEGEGDASTREKFKNKRLIGIPCSVCPYWLNERPEKCPIIIDIDSTKECPLYIEQELAVSKINLRALSHYYILKHNLLGLYTKLYEILQEIVCKDSQALHEFLATLRRFMPSKFSPPRLPYQLIVTTNYDEMLEQVFLDMDQPFDVVFYVADGDERGKFKHKSYEGNVQTIDTQDYNRLPLRRACKWGDAGQPRPIILKLFGTCDKRQETKFVATEQQLTFLLDNLQQNLPASLISILSECSILFMGYSPRDTDLNRIVHCLWSRNRMPNSYLLHQAQLGYLEKEIWEKRNVDLIQTSLNDFVTQLKEGIEAKIQVIRKRMK